MMDKATSPRLRLTETVVYKIAIQGELACHWRKLFNDMGITIATKQGTTSLFCQLDQAKLHGLLAQIRDLGLPLISINILPGPLKQQDSQGEIG